MRNSKWWWAEFLYVWETSIVNAYLLMKKYYLARGLTPRLTHLEFQEEITWSLLDPKGPPRRGRESPIKASTPTPPRAPAGAARARMTEKSLQPGGAFDRRLDRSLHHCPTMLPADKKKTTVCQFHRLAGKSINKNHAIPEGARRDVMICQDCNAAVCVKCWEVFHYKEVIGDADLCRVLK